MGEYNKKFVMINLNFFIVTYDRLYDSSVNLLDKNELNKLKCYTVQKSVPKSIISNVDIINEWELEWNDYSYQTKQYYEYSIFPHLLKNAYLIDDLTHVGLLHYDIIFQKNSVNDIVHEISKSKDKIFYQRIRGVDDLYLTKYELDMLCDFMGTRLNLKIDSNQIWKNGWISEALSVTPVSVFKKFAEFIIKYSDEIENILIENKWGIMNNINHRVCGIIERMWGFYLVSVGMQLVPMNIIHDWDSYRHQHTFEPNWITLN